MKNLKILKQLNVLLAEDDFMLREATARTLGCYFNTVFTASNGKEALEIYRQQSCHLLPVDYDMPKMNGVKFLQRVRQEDDSTPAAIVSAYDEKTNLKEALRLNLLDYLTKPWDMHELIDLLHKSVAWMERKGLLRDTASVRIHSTASLIRASQKMGAKQLLPPLNQPSLRH